MKMQPNFDVVPPQPEQEFKIEVVEQELLDAAKYSKYLLNVLKAAPEAIKRSPEFLAIMKEANAREEEIREYEKLLAEKGD